MESKQFSVGEIVKYGWKTMREHIGFFIALLIIGTLISGIPAAAHAWTMQANQETWVSFAIAILQLILSWMVALGYMRVSLSFVDNKKPSVKELFTVLPKVFTYLIASILYSLILVVGFCLLVFPSVIWGVKYMLYPYFILDKGAGPIEALKMSGEATTGAKWDLFSYVFVASVIVLAGALCLFVGLFAALPTVMVGNAFIYRRLAG